MYNTITTADVYFNNRYGYDLWNELDETSKNQALSSASSYLDLSCDWYGDKCDESQTPAFPRTPDCPNIPFNILYAECEIAYLMIENGSAKNTIDDTLLKLKAGPVELGFKGDTSPYSDPFMSTYINQLLLPYGECTITTGSTTLIPIERQ